MSDDTIFKTPALTPRPYCRNYSDEEIQILADRLDDWSGSKLADGNETLEADLFAASRMLLVLLNERDAKTGLTIEDLSRLSDRLSAHADAITNAAATRIAEDMRLAGRAVGWIVVTQNALGEKIGSITKQVHTWRANGVGDISQEELVDELEGALADISRILAREI